MFDYPDVFSDVTISDCMFRRFNEFIEAELGIKMPVSQKTMLQVQLQKRLRILGIRSFDEYGDYIFSEEGKKH